MPDQAAPLPSPLAVDEGELTLIQDDGQFSISGGELVIPAQSTPAWGDLGFYDATNHARTAGLTTLSKLTFTALEVMLLGNAWAIALVSRLDFDSAFYLTDASGVEYFGSEDYFLAIGNVAIATEYDVIIVTQNLGSRVYIRGGAYTDWTLQHVNHTGDRQTLHPALSNMSSQAAMSLFRFADLPGNATFAVPALGTRDLDLCTPGTGSGTSSIAAPAVGNTFVHTADFKLTFDLTTLPSSGVAIFRFRKQDNDNHWYLRWNSAGEFRLYEKVATVDSLRINMTVTAGKKVTILPLDENISIFEDGVLKGTYANAVNFKTETDGEINNLGIGGVLANLEAKTLDGVANLTSSNHPGLGPATDVLPGPRQAADTFTHEADFVGEFMLDAIPSISDILIFFRYQDATHQWQLKIDTAGNFQLRENNAGIAIRGSAAGVLSGGERITIICDDEEIRGYYDTTLAWAYSSAANFKTETSGEINSLGTGGQVSDLITRPYNLASAPNTPEASSVRAAFDLMTTP
jgi:hypothetical protein